MERPTDSISEPQPTQLKTKKGCVPSKEYRDAEAQEAKAKRRQRQKEEVDPGLGDADPAPGFGPLKVSPLSYALSQQDLCYDCSSHISPEAIPLTLDNLD